MSTKPNGKIYMNLPDQNTKLSLGQKAYSQIYRRIMTLAYAPGQRLEEKKLVAELGIGRTPVREALMRLADDFMVETHPNKGAVVRPISLPNTRAMFAAVRVLEAGVAELAVQEDNQKYCLEMEEANESMRAAVKDMDALLMVEANSRFHHLYALCSHNDYLMNALHKVRCESNRLAYLSFGKELDPQRTLSAHYESVLDEHAKIIHAIKVRDGGLLKQTILIHIRTFQTRIVNYMMT
jgi:DNA-binding GntR family transcriptional regulator